jgi:hypothetical protein
MKTGVEKEPEEPERRVGQRPFRLLRDS